MTKIRDQNQGPKSVAKIRDQIRDKNQGPKSVTKIPQCGPGATSQALLGTSREQVLEENNPAGAGVHGGGGQHLSDPRDSLTPVRSREQREGGKEGRMDGLQIVFN